MHMRLRYITFYVHEIDADQCMASLYQFLTRPLHPKSSSYTIDHDFGFSAPDGRRLGRDLGVDKVVE